MLSDLSAEDLSSLSDPDFQDEVKSSARLRASDAFDIYDSVMHESDDDRARLQAADRILSLAGAKDASLTLPSGVSEDVFRLALAGLGQIAGIAVASQAADKLIRDVTPKAESSPKPSPPIRQTQSIKPTFTDDSPLNRVLAFNTQEETS